MSGNTKGQAASKMSMLHIQYYRNNTKTYIEFTDVSCRSSIIQCFTPYSLPLLLTSCCMNNISLYGTQTHSKSQHLSAKLEFLKWINVKSGLKVHHNFSFVIYDDQVLMPAVIPQSRIDLCKCCIPTAYAVLQ